VPGVLAEVACPDWQERTIDRSEVRMTSWNRYTCDGCGEAFDTPATLPEGKRLCRECREQNER
jgi:formylmethanofuran dehydrogenase subunit E